MPSKSVLYRGFKTEAERISEELRWDMGISKFDPLDAFALAKHLNIDIFTVDEVFSALPFDRTKELLNETDRFSAMHTPNKDGRTIIIHNQNHSGYRQQSNLMHELSHVIRKHTVPEKEARLCTQFNLHYYNPLHEQEAKYLGGCLQITRAGLAWALKNNFSNQKISEYFNASEDMVNYRLGVTGVLKQRSFYIG